MTLHWQDEKDLGKFFAEYGRAQRSIQGPILDKMFLMSVKRKKSKEPITARPTAEVRLVTAVEPDVSEHALFGRVSTTLKMIAPRHGIVLEAFYGDMGSCCAEHEGTDRIVALYPLTRPGRSIAAQERKSAGELKLSTLEHIQNAVARSKKGGNVPLLDMVTQAHSQAVAMQASAEAAYTRASEELEASRPPKERPRFLRIVGGDE